MSGVSHGSATSPVRLRPRLLFLIQILLLWRLAMAFAVGQWGVMWENDKLHMKFSIFRSLSFNFIVDV